MPATNGIGMSAAALPPVEIPRNIPGLRPGQGESPAAVGKAFEAMFASLLIKQMRQALEDNTLFAGDTGDVRGGMFDHYLGEHISASGKLGIADMVRHQLERRSART